MFVVSSNGSEHVTNMVIVCLGGCGLNQQCGIEVVIPTLRRSTLRGTAHPHPPQATLARPNIKLLLRASVR